MAVPNFLNSKIHGAFSIFGMQMGDPWDPIMKRTRRRIPGIPVRGP
jgi:hypothetical protein